MSHSRIFAAALCGLALAVSAGCASPAKPRREALALRAMSLSERQDQAVITADYPAFPGHPLLDVAIRAFVEDEAGAFRSASAESWKALAATAAPGEDPGSRPPHELLITWKADSLRADRVSILLESYSYVGGAHGNTRLASVNYDPVQRRFVGLGDILDHKPDDWLSVLATAARRSLAAELGEDFAPDPTFAGGLEPRPDNFSCFTFDASTVTIHFQRYQAGPGSLGTPSVALPRDMSLCSR